MFFNRGSAARYCTASLHQVFRKKFESTKFLKIQIKELHSRDMEDEELDVQSRKTSAVMRASHHSVILFVCLFVLFILLTRGKMSDVKHRVIAQTHFRRYRQYHVRLFFYLVFYFFFSHKCRCETDPCAVFSHHTKNLLGN